MPTYDISINIDLIYYLVLIVANSPFIIAFVSIGYLSIHPNAFKEIQLVILTAILVNIILKETFQMQPLLGHAGWSFPSGHSHVFAVLCISLLIFFRNKALFVTTILLLTTLPFALVHYNHHYYSDIIAAYIYSIGTIGIFYSIKQLFAGINTSTSIKILLLGLFTLNLIVYISFGSISFLSTSITLIIFFCGSNILAFDKEFLQTLSLKRRIIVNIVTLFSLSIIYLIIQLGTFMPDIIKNFLEHSGYSLSAILVSCIIPKYLIFHKSRAG